MLKLGSTGEQVAEMQRRLGIMADGSFGPATQAAVIAYQKSRGLVADGVAGPKTLLALMGGDTSKLLAQRDLESAAKELGVPLAVVQAVNAVESRGTGFIGDLPVILFERHIMYRQIAKDGMDADLVARAIPDVVSKSRGGYRGGRFEHQRLDAAKRIHRDAAIESASWGLFQIMGFHWQRLGYTSPQDYEAQMRESEGKQLEAFVRFVKADGNIHQAMRERNWPRLAALYNGPAYKDNLYDVKLARAYERFAGVTA